MEDDSQRATWILIGGAIAFILIGIVAGLLFVSSGKSTPIVVINSPASNAQAKVGEQVSIQSTATDKKGVIRVDLIVDGLTVHTEHAAVPQASFSVIQTWRPSAPGTHQISVVAYNKDAVASAPAMITLNVLEGPAPTSTAPPPTGAPCKYDAAFVADVTAPDGTAYLPGQRFDKTWRLRNSGTCAWGTNFQFVFVGGEAMSTIQSVAAPNVAPGHTADLTVQMTAPATHGVHAGQWRMRDGAGNLFGVEVHVKINVVAPQPTACTPQISSFTADRTTIHRGESTVLRWGAVSNAQTVDIDNGIGSVGTPGERVVAPNQTTTFTLHAACGSTRVSKSVTITVIQPQTPTPTQTPQRRNISGQWSSGNHTLNLQEAMGCSGPTCNVSGTYSEWTSGTPILATVNGTVNVNTGAVSLNLVQEMPGAPVKTFIGALNADSRQLSGNLSGVGQITFIKQ